VGVAHQDLEQQLQLQQQALLAMLEADTSKHMATRDASAATGGIFPTKDHRLAIYMACSGWETSASARNKDKRNPARLKTTSFADQLHHVVQGMASVQETCAQNAHHL
jgi:hypothetical protein